VIVTRRRRRRPRIGRYILPLLALVALAVALAWPPSHNAIANGPLKPVWSFTGGVLAQASRPISFTAQQQQLVERNREIRALNAQLEQSRQAQAADDARVAQMQQQVDSVLRQPKPTVAPLPRGSAGPGGAAQLAQNGAAGAAPTDDEKRLAQTWAAMDPTKASALAQRLPVDEVSRILRSMDPDDAAEILNALPPKLGAQVSAAVAQVPQPISR
jgi:flagellar motility protein MotE (MotC chaperone)